MRKGWFDSWLALVTLMMLCAVLPPAASAQSGPAAARFSDAFERLRVGDLEAARKGFEEGLALEPANGLAHYYLAETQSRLDDQRTALRHYERAASLLGDSNEGRLASQRVQELNRLLPWLGRWRDALFVPALVGAFRLRGSELVFVVQQPGYDTKIQSGDILFKGTPNGANSLSGVFLKTAATNADTPMRASIDAERGVIRVEDHTGFRFRLTRVP